MKTSSKIVVGIIGLAVVMGIAAYVYVARPVDAPSAPIGEGVTPVATSTQSRTFALSQASSTVSFTIDEILNNKPKTVVGTTTQVAGEISVSPENLSAMQIGQIRVNARTLKTDSNNRNGALARFILKSEDAANEFIVFTPKTISGLPASASIGVPFSFQVTGDLLVTGVTKPVTFDAKGTFESADVFSGSAQTTVLYKDFGLTIPKVPAVASVEDEVILAIDFVAVAQ